MICEDRAISEFIESMSLELPNPAKEDFFMNFYQKSAHSGGHKTLDNRNPALLLSRWPDRVAWYHFATLTAQSEIILFLNWVVFEATRSGFPFGLTVVAKKAKIKTTGGSSPSERSSRIFQKEACSSTETLLARSPRGDVLSAKFAPNTYPNTPCRPASMLQGFHENGELTIRLSKKLKTILIMKISKLHVIREHGIGGGSEG